jgi:hypothetical protein
MNSIPPTKEEGAVSQVHMNGLFLEKPGLLKEALKLEEEWARAVPGYDSTMTRHKRPMTTLERSLYKLNAVRELGEWAKDFVDSDRDLEDDGSDGNMGKPMQLVGGDSWEQGMKEVESGGQFDPDTSVVYEEDGIEFLDEMKAFNDTEAGVPTFYSQPCITAMPTAAVLQNSKGVPIRRDSVIVIIRHGKTEHNKLGLFTGWVSGVSNVPFCVVLLLSMLTRRIYSCLQEDAPLADDGIVEAQEAGRLLKLHGFEFDVVYTSWLSRALETAWYVMDEMDALWLPIVKTWRLNEVCVQDLSK